MTLAHVLIVVVAVGSCVKPVPTPEEVEKKPRPVANCETACAQLISMGCPAAEGGPGQDDVMGTGDDQSCVEVCRVLSFTVPMDVVCVSTAQSCEEADNCGG